MKVLVQKKECVRLVLPRDLGPQCLQDELHVVSHQHEPLSYVFLDTFEWGLWLGGHALYRCGDVYRLCIHENGWLGEVVCEEEAADRRHFWGDFTTAPMRAKLEGMLGLRGLSTVVEGTFRLRLEELRNKIGKIVCRLEWTTVSAGKHGGEELLHFCHVMPLLGYEAEAAHVEECLTLRGASTVGAGPLEVLLRHAQIEPLKYTLKPVFGLKRDTPAREAIGRIVRPILGIANRNIPGILNDIDTEFLHDYRICLRKIRSVLSLVKEVYPYDGTERMRKILGDLARETNRLRDLDVYLLARDEYLGLLPPQLRPALEEMFEDFSAEREVEVRRVALKMRASSSRKLLQELEDFFFAETPHGPSPHADLPVGPLVFRSIYKRYRKIRAIAAGIGAETPDEAVHQIRIECKKLRYLLEFFTELIPVEEGAAMQKTMRRLQGRLGEFNDASVQQKSLMDYWEQKKTGHEVALGLGGLVSILYQQQKRTRGLIEQALVGFSDASTVAAFKAIFKHPASTPTTDAPRDAHQ